MAWFSSIEDVATVAGRTVLALQVDTQWIARAGAQAPFTLRDVYVQARRACVFTYAQGRAHLDPVVAR